MLSEIKSKIDTPNCPKCGSNRHWTIARKLEEHKGWDPIAMSFDDEYVECSDLWVFCGSCDYDADPNDEIYKLLENQ